MGAALSLGAAGLGAAGAGLCAEHPQLCYALPVLLAAVALAAAIVVGARRAMPGGRILSALAAALAAVAVAWSFVADPQCSLLGLRQTLAQQTGGVSRPDDAGPTALDTAWVELTQDGLTARVRRGTLAAEFINGHLAHAGAPGTAPAPVALAVALPLAYAGATAHVGVVAPALPATLECARALAGEGRVQAFRLWGRSDGTAFDVVVCGPGAFSAAGSPLRALSREAMRAIRTRLAPGGVLGLWLPVAAVEPGVLRRALATVRSAFPAFQLFLCEHEAVLVAVADPRLRWERLRALQAPLRGAGFWGPMDLVRGYAADAGELASVMDGVPPYTLSRPRRMPVLARRPAPRAWAASPALLAQYRLAGPERLLGQLAFESENQRVVALHGFEGIYAEQTRESLRRLGRLALGGPAEDLMALVRGPLVRRELFADAAEGQDVQTAAVFLALGLPEAAAAALQKALESGRDDPGLHVRLAGVLEALNRPDDALGHYREALGLDPASAVVQQRMTALLVALGRYREAAESLERVLKDQPDNVRAMLMLGQLYAGTLGRPERAAPLAQRVLDLEPGNPAAHELLLLCGGASSPPAAR